MKFNYLLFFFVLLLFSSGCTNKKPIPSDMLPEDTLVNIIVDMHLGDAILLQPNVQSLPYVINKQEYYFSILKKHSITKEIFEKNINFYANHPEEYDLIYEKVIEELSTIQGNILKPDTL
jgi:hypothetical protein